MMREIEAIFSGGLTTCQVCPERKSRYAQWICANCREVVEERLSPEVLRLLLLRRLRQAGYPFGRDELDFEDWLHLGEMEELIAGLRLSRSSRPEV
jgi:hypothetical protein